MILNRIVSESGSVLTHPSAADVSAGTTYSQSTHQKMSSAARLSGQLHFPSMDHVNQGVYYTDVTLDPDIRALR